MMYILRKTVNFFKSIPHLFKSVANLFKVIVNFFKNIPHLPKKIWKLTIHSKLFHNQHSLIVAMILLVFIVLLCICPCWAQYLDKKDSKKNHKPWAPTWDQYNQCQTFGIGEPEPEEEITESEIFIRNK
jgi:hypothetical protein